MSDRDLDDEVREGVDDPNAGRAKVSDPGAGDLVHAAEYATLGAILLRPVLLAEANSVISSKDFADPIAALVFDAMNGLDLAGTPIDRLTLEAELTGRGQIDRVRARLDLAVLIDACPNPANLPAYLQQVAKAALGRRLCRATDEATIRIQSANADPAEVLAQLRRDLDAEEDHATGCRSNNALAAQWRPLGRACLEVLPPRRECLLTDAEGGDVLPLGRAGMIVGEGGASKTFVLCHLALSVATGAPWFGLLTPPEGGRVLLVLAEEELSEVQRRLYRAAKAMNLNPSDHDRAATRIVPLALSGTPVALLDAQGRDTAFALQLRRRLAEGEQPWACIILDPFARFAGPEAEVDNFAATRAVQALERLTEAPGHPTVIVAHHTNKTSRSRALSGEAADTVDARGATGLTDGVRWVATLKPMRRPRDVRADNGEMIEGAVWFQVVKSNYGWFPPPTLVVRDSATHGALRVATPAEIKRILEPVAEPAGVAAPKPGRRAGGAPGGCCGCEPHRGAADQVASALHEVADDAHPRPS